MIERLNNFLRLFLFINLAVGLMIYIIFFSILFDNKNFIEIGNAIATNAEVFINISLLGLLTIIGGIILYV